MSAPAWHHRGHRQHQHLWPDRHRAAAGSGFVITEDGYILTNYHVIDGANSIKVTFSDGKEYTATYVGGEEANDIAVIKVEATGLTPWSLAAPATCWWGSRSPPSATPWES